MTPKLKAEQLVEKYEKIELLKNYDGMYRELAIECAKIAVDEIIVNTDMYVGNLNPKWSFWQEVKQELEKM